MKKKFLLLTVLPLLLISCNEVVNSSSTSSDGEFASSFDPIRGSTSSTNTSIDNANETYEKLDETLFNKLKNGGINVSGEVNWKFSGQVTDSSTGQTYDASEKIQLNKFMGQNSSTLYSEVRIASQTTDEEKADATYNFKVYRNQKGMLTKLYLGADNKIHEVPYVHEEIDEDGYTQQVETSYDYYFGNPFKNIEFKDLNQASNGAYNINSFVIDDFSTSLIFFGEMFEFEMNTATLFIKDGILNATIKSNRTSYEDTGIYTWLEANLTIYLATENDISKPLVYDHAEENAPLRQAFDELANSLINDGKGFTYNYTEKIGNTDYATYTTRMNSKGYVALNNKQQKINGVAKYENNINYYFNIYDGINPIKSGKSNSLLLPNYSSEFVSEDVFTKVDENIYEVKTSTLAKYVAEQIIDNEHKNTIDGHNSIYSSSYQGTNALRIELKDGHVSTITYNYVASNKLIDGIINVTNINATSLGFIFKTKDLRPIQPGYENFCGYFDSWEYGTSDDIDNKEYYHLLVYGDGKYSISYKTTGETEEIKQGILNKENNTFTIVLKGEQITLTYCPAGTKMDLGYASLTERSFPVLYGKTDDKSHIVTFKLDQNSEYNIDSGLVKGE